MVSPGPPIIELENVSVSFNGTGAVLDRVNLRIARGEFVYLVGPTGAGKSTLLRLLYCDLAPVSGVVRVEGRRLCDLRRCDVPKLRRRMGVVFQDFGLLADRKVYENVAFALRVLGVGNRLIRKAVAEALELVGLLDRSHAYPRELSGGEQQRVAIARALVNNPPLLLADEPTGNLDPETSLGIAEVLEAANRMGTTVVVATHDRYMVNSYRHRVVEIGRGKVVRDESLGLYDALPRDGE